MRDVFMSVMAGLFLAGGSAWAEGTETPAIDQRVLNQERRIQEGVNSGQLTEGEANRMNSRLERIENAEAHAKADGQVTAKEHRRLNRALNHNSKKIYKEKHDRQQR
jgi:hypothetical protein